MSERQFVVSGDWVLSGNWALGGDNLQWILYKKRSHKRGGWKGVSFVNSERDILERCMQEKGCPEQDRAVLLAGLPPTFKE